MDGLEWKILWKWMNLGYPHFRKFPCGYWMFSDFLKFASQVSFDFRHSPTKVLCVLVWWIEPPDWHVARTPDAEVPQIIQSKTIETCWNMLKPMVKYGYGVPPFEDIWGNPHMSEWFHLQKDSAPSTCQRGHSAGFGGCRVQWGLAFWFVESLKVCCIRYKPLKVFLDHVCILKR